MCSYICGLGNKSDIDVWQRCTFAKTQMQNKHSNIYVFLQNITIQTTTQRQSTLMTLKPFFSADANSSDMSVFGATRIVFS
jgi:uncharacterized protein affecting Mg2+/Co2+ transport